MAELGVTKGTLLVEKEPCQICDRSVYPGKTGPETPMTSSRTGKPIDRQISKINTALPQGSQLTVVDPESASIYRGVKPAVTPRPPASGATGAKAERPATESKPQSKPQAKPGAAAEPAPPRAGAAPKAGSAPRAGTAKPAAPRVQPAAAAAAPTTSSKTQPVARAAARELAADFRALRVARGITGALQIVSFIATLQTLDTFSKMTASSLAGKGFILTKEIAEAQSLQKKAAALQRDYAPFSEGLSGKSLTFMKAAADPLAAGRAASSISDLDTSLELLRIDLADRIARIDTARREAEAKQKAAEAILADPKASAAIAMATLGTAELAQLFAAAQDLQRIAGALRSASSDLTSVKKLVDDDYDFIHSWFQTLFDICRKGGHCGLKTIRIPFVGTSNIHILPGEE